LIIRHGRKKSEPFGELLGTNYGPLRRRRGGLEQAASLRAKK
jgi:hypothetical protein